MEIRTVADLAPVIDGRPDITKFTTIQLRELAETNRPQRLIFIAAQRLYEQMKDEWGGNQTYLIAQLIRIIEKFIEKGKIRIIPIDWNQDEMKRRIAHSSIQIEQ
jgi:type III restriction enzyme